MPLRSARSLFLRLLVRDSTLDFDDYLQNTLVRNGATFIATPRGCEVLVSAKISSIIAFVSRDPDDRRSSYQSFAMKPPMIVKTTARKPTESSMNEFSCPLGTALKSSFDILKNSLPFQTSESRNYLIMFGIQTKYTRASKNDHRVYAHRRRHRRLKHFNYPALANKRRARECTQAIRVKIIRPDYVREAAKH